MKQLRIREPWADLAASDHDLILDLIQRVRALEERVRDLEEISERTSEGEPVGV